MSQRDNEIFDILEGYAQYYPVICQILQILPKKQETQPEVWSCTKLVIMTPWRALCVNLIGQCTLEGKDNKSIDFMCLTMNEPTTSWFEITQLPTITKLTVPNMGKGNKATLYDTHLGEYFSCEGVFFHLSQNATETE